jgi:uncharacterized membrane protein YkvA (DUF1232 family)
MLEKAKQWARRLKRDVVALYLAGRDPRTPWHAKAVAIAVAAYAISPIDLIPDFIPILGYLDDLIILPLGIMLAVRLIPAELMEEFRQASRARERLPANWVGAAAIIAIWIGGLVVLALYFAPYLAS